MNVVDREAVREVGEEWDVEEEFAEVVDVDEERLKEEEEDRLV